MVQVLKPLLGVWGEWLPKDSKTEVAVRWVSG